MTYESELRRASRKREQAEPYVQETTEAIQGVLDHGKRSQGGREMGPESNLDGDEAYRVRKGPTRSERMNRALKELSPSAFKIQMLLWTWRGAPHRGHLPFFTIHSLAKFCNSTRPTMRSGLLELERKGYIQRLPYNPHVKNALYRLVGVRRIPRPCKKDTTLTSGATTIGPGGPSPELTHNSKTPHDV